LGFTDKFQNVSLDHTLEREKDIMTFYVCYAGLGNKEPRIFVTEDETEVDLLPVEWSMREVDFVEDLKELNSSICLQIYNKGFEREARRFENTETRCRLTLDAIPKYLVKYKDAKKPWETAANKNNPNSKKKGIGKFVEGLIEEGLKNKEIHKRVKEEFPDSRLAKDGKNISWYRNQLRKRKEENGQSN
jgi:hypothetical protein